MQLTLKDNYTTLNDSLDLSIASRKLSKYLDRVVVLVLLCPLLILLHFYLKRIKRKLLSLDVNVENITKEQYSYLKRSNDTLMAQISSLSPVSNREVEVNEMPSLVRGVAKQLLEIEKLSLDKANAIDKKLKTLDEVSLDVSSGFRVVTENELWQNRPSSYQYLA